MSRPHSDRLDAYFDYLAAICPPALQVWTATTESDFCAAVEKAIESAVLQLESGAHRCGSMDELGLSWLLVAFLTSASIPVVCEGASQGNVYLTVKHPADSLFLILGQCKIYKGYDHHYASCKQLLMRWSSGRSARSFCLEFFRSPEMYEELQKLREKFNSRRPLKQINDATGHAIKGAFVTLHKHFTATTVGVVHLGCNVFYPETTELADAMISIDATDRTEASRQNIVARARVLTTEPNEPPSPRPQMKKHTILFLAANPTETAQLALDREARAIQKELESAGFRDRFELVTRWAVEPLDLLRELRKLKPTVVHFSGHGGQRGHGEQRPGMAPAPRRDIIGDPDVVGSEQPHGLFFQGTDGRAQFVSAQAIEETFGAAGSSVKLVVLNACYSDVQADALLTHIDCVVGMSGSIRDDAARNFAIGFYGGLGERESVAAAYKQGRAAISLEGLPDGERPQLKVRDAVDASQLVLAADPQ